MQLYELMEQLQNKTTKPVYIFTGEEIAIMDIYIKQIVTLLDAIPRRVDSLGSVFSKLKNSSFLAKKACYIIRDDKDYMTQEKVWQSVNSGAIQGDNTIILVYTTIDKRSKFYKQHQDMIVNFEKLPSTILAKYIAKEIGLQGELAANLAQVCDNDYSRILLECDKINHLHNARGISIEDAYKQALAEGVIYKQPQDVVFEFIDAVCKRRVKLTYELLEELKETGEPPLIIITLLYNNMRQMLLVQSAGDTNDIEGRTGLSAWQIKCAKEKGKHYAVPELVRALRVIRETERGIKAGTVESTLAVDYILVNIL